MTREEAIRMLKSKMDGHTDTSYEWAETVRMAIQALEQEPILDKIRAEISNLDDADYDYEGYFKAVTDAVEIIDKYRGEA